MVPSYFGVLSGEEIERLHDSALRIVRDIRFRSDSPLLTDLMRSSGALEGNGIIRL